MSNKCCKFVKNKNTMRTIKFRMWDGRAMLSPEIADEYDFFIAADGRCRKLVDSGTYNGTYYPTTTDSSCTLMQFTGLCDKNGNEIYEGDIVKVKKCYQESFVVEYSAPAFLLIDGKDGCLGEPDITWEDWKEFEVIGNIHENKQ